MPAFPVCEPLPTRWVVLSYLMVLPVSYFLSVCRANEIVFSVFVARTILPSCCINNNVCASRLRCLPSTRVRILTVKQFRCHRPGLGSREQSYCLACVRRCYRPHSLPCRPIRRQGKHDQLLLPPEPLFLRPWLPLNRAMAAWGGGVGERGQGF